MRDIKFRGKRTDNGEWVYGSLLQSEIDVNEINVNTAICERFAFDYNISQHEVDPETIGQFTGLKDKNGKEIYEGDILKNSLTFLNGEMVDKNNPVYKNYVADWHNGNSLGFRIKNRRNIMPLNSQKVFNADSEIIGNIHQNPDLLTP